MEREKEGAVEGGGCCIFEIIPPHFPEKGNPVNQEVPLKKRIRNFLTTGFPPSRE